MMRNKIGYVAKNKGSFCLDDMTFSSSLPKLKEMFGDSQEYVKVMVQFQEKEVRD